MRDIFKTFSDVTGSDWFNGISYQSAPKQSRVFKSTRLEDMIYRDLSNNNQELQDICQSGKLQLSSFDSLAQDIFTGFYSLSPKQRDESELSNDARRFNRPIIEKTTAEDDYTAIKEICEGRELPSFDASVEFADNIRERLPELMDAMPDNKTTEVLEKQAAELKRKLKDLCELNEQSPQANREKKIVQIANKIYKKESQISELEAKAVDAMIKAGPAVKEAVAVALEAALEKAQETDDLIQAWGSGSGNPRDIKADEEIFNRVRKNPKLLEMSRILGRYIKMLTDKRQNGFDYGLGQKYDITLGNDLNLCLSSEMALLATPETQPLFLRKYQAKKLKQYRKRDRITKGKGDIIVCVDESTSMNNCILWAKAIAFTLLNATVKDKRKFALIRFSGDIQTHLFLPGQFKTEALFAAVNSFMGGGTNFMKPLTEACRLIFDEGFENADIVFITDGECEISDNFAERLRQARDEKNFNIQGILLNKNDLDAGQSLIPFCDKIYTESDLGLEGIAESVMGNFS